MAVDWTDPCAKAAALREAYYTLVQGAQEASIRIRNGEHEREVAYSKVDLKTLQTEYQLAEAACAQKNGTGGRRFAITAGSRRR